ncbi:MAG: M28 family peptidase [Bryobacteraceae bacterium]|nr:M28 family peptidase [Bryobacteraceae bacterium]
MLRRKAILILFLCFAPAVPAAEFSGESAYRFTEKAVSFGPRIPGSEALEKLRRYILSVLKPLGCEVTLDTFTARTPLGPVVMKNIIARFPGQSGRAVAITGHYDTKVFREFRFVGANDAGSSTGFLLEIARVLANRPRKDDVYLVWFDGEEAFVEWSPQDGLYGSRHLASRWSAEGVLWRLKALINVDMIGDKDLRILREANSSEALTNLIWQAARDLGYGRYFLNQEISIDDDHMPFVRAGVRSVNLIDFDYGPNHSWWHTEHDTMDKLNPKSFQIVGEVVLESLRRLESW